MFSSVGAQYLCDGADDCADGYDEDKLLCTAGRRDPDSLPVVGNNWNKIPSRLFSSARRPPVEETASFLQSLLKSHGSNFLEILFGPRAKNNMKKLGGIQNVAIVLSGWEGRPQSWFITVNRYLESYTIDDFAEALRLTSTDLHNLKLIFHSVEQGDLGVLSAIGVKVKLA